MAWSEAARERERYENRLKWERDVSVMKKDAREEGVKEGLEKGEEKGRIEGRIHLSRRLSKQPPTPAE